MVVQIIYPADRLSWLAARQQDVTASIAACLFDVHPHTSPYQMWAEKTGRASPDHTETPAMRRGKLLEPVAVEMIREDYPDWTVTYRNDRAYYRDTERRIGATPDAFLERPDRHGVGNCQIKTASEEAFRDYWFDPDTGDVVPPTWIAVQAITEAKLTGCTWSCVALMVLNKRAELHLHIVDIPMPPRLWTRLCDEVATFWSMVDAGMEPPPDWSRDGPAVLDVMRDSKPERKDMSDDPAMDIILSKYAELKEIRAEVSKKMDVLKPQIIYGLGNAEAGLTESWSFTARTQLRSAFEARESQSRVLRLKRRK